MNHQPFETWILDPEHLTPEQSAELEKHLGSCADCRQKQFAWKSVHNLIRTAPPITAPSGFAVRFQNSLAERRAQAHRRQVRTMLWILGGAITIVVLFLLLRLFAATSLVDMISAGIHTLASTPQRILEFRYVASFWLGELPPLAVYAAIFLVAGWTIVLVATWVLAMIRISRQGVIGQ